MLVQNPNDPAAINALRLLKKTEWPKNSGLCVEKKFAVFTCAAKRVSLRAFKRILFYIRLF